MPVNGFAPLSRTLPYWPSDLLGQFNLLEELGIQNFQVQLSSDFFVVSGTLLWFREIILEIPSLNGFQIVLLNRDGFTAIAFSLDIRPSFSLRLPELSIALRLQTDLLQPVRQEGEDWVPILIGEESSPVQLSLNNIGVQADANGNVEILMPAGAPSVGLGALKVADSGIIVIVNQLSPYFSDAQIFPPEVPANFKGVWIQNAEVIYHKQGSQIDWTFALRNAAIGSGGFSGTVSLGHALSETEQPPELSGDQLEALFSETRTEEEEVRNLTRDIYPVQIEGMRAAIQHFGLTFVQSIPTGSRIAGYIYMPFAEKWLRLEASLGGPNGDFMMQVGGAGDAGLVDLNNDWFQIIVDSIRYELRKNDRDESIHYAIINGSVKPKIAGFDWPIFEVERLAISSEGDVELDGGWIDVPETFTLDFHGFKIDVNQLGMGNEEGDTRQWLGFSGNITLVEGIPLSASVQGLKFSWNKDSSGGAGLKVSLEGIAVHLEIPNTLILDGSVRYREITREEAEALPPESPTRYYGHLFTGSVTLDITALKTSVNGELLIGDLTDVDTGESFTAFYIVLNAQLPTAIPLGATGTGLYGLAGLFGIHVAPNRQLAGTEPEPWYLWYKSDRGNNSAYNVTKVVKWGSRFDNFAFGAGLSLGTIYDDGFTINVGALVVILIPGPVIMIEGRANLLKERGKGETTGKNAEGALYALIVFDGIAETFQMNVDINYTLEDVITVGGGMEAFFDFKDSTKWYIHIGKKDPETKRIRAEILSIVTASSYFMINPAAIQFGAAAGINLNLEYGPLIIRLILRLRFEIGLFFKEPQLTGLIELYIELTIKIFGIGIGLILQALLEGSAPQPWWIHGKARAALSLPFPLPSFDVQVEFTWGEDGEPARVDLLKGASMIHPKQIGTSWTLATELENAPVVPVDAIAVLSCGKPISMVSTEPAELGGIQWFQFETVEGWEFGYDFKKIKLVEVDKNGVEVEVPIYPRDSDDTPSGEFNDAVGPTTPQYPWLTGGGIYQLPIENNQGDQSANNIREPQILLWQYSPLSAMHPEYQERYVNPCRTLQRSPKIQCVHWQNAAADTTYPLVFNYENLWFATNLSSSQLNSSFSRVVGDRQTDRGLSTIGLTIRFPEPVTWVRITFVSAPGSCISYYRGQQVPENRTNRTGSNPTPNPYQVSGLADAINISNDPRVAYIPTVIQEICYITKRNQDTVWSGAQNSGEFDGTPMVDTPFLKPNISYRLEVHAQRRERKIGENPGFTPQRQEVIYYFKTAAAPGLNDSSEQSRSKEAQKVDFRDDPLNRLETYIARTVPQDGAKLFYRGYRVLVEFNEPYVKNFYQNDLSLQVKDRNGKLLSGGSIAWLNSGLPLLTPGLLTILSAPNQQECEDQRSNVQPSEKQYLSCVLPNTVQPGKMYIVEVVSGERLLYQFQFATSHYRTITEHLESGLPHGSEGNVVSRNQSIQPGLPHSEQSPGLSWWNRYDELQRMIVEKREELSDAYALSGSTDVKPIPEATEALHSARKELHQFSVETFCWLDCGGTHPNSELATLTYPGIHRLFESIGLGHRPLPRKVELIQIRIAGTTNCFLLLESPEPLEWQRLKLTLRDLQLPVVWNDDQTRAFIFNSNGSDGSARFFTAEHYNFRFEYNRGAAERDGFSSYDLKPLYKDGDLGQEVIDWTINLASMA